MKTRIISLGLLCVMGCQTSSRQASCRREPAFLPAVGALVFTPPFAIQGEELDLARENRGVYALGGEEYVVIDTTYVIQDDRQRFDRFGDWGRFERRAVSTSVTVRRR